MSEMIVNAKCPYCKQWGEMMFSGSGSNGECPHCKKNIPNVRKIKEYWVLAYSG